MTRKVKRRFNPSELGEGGLKKAKQILEDRIEYNTLREIAEEGNQESYENPPSSQTEGYNPEILSQYTEYLNSLPEEQRGVAMQLIATLHGGGGKSGMEMNPMTLMLMNMMNQNNNTNNDDATVKMIENQNNVLIELIKNVGGNNNNEVLVELIKNMGNNNNNESTSDLIKAVNEMNGGNDEDRELINNLLLSVISNQGGDDDDKMFEKLKKMREAGLITDPQTLFEVKKLEADSEREKYKADRDHDIKKLEIDKDREQTDKASEFLSEIAKTVENLNEGGTEDETKSESSGQPAQQVELNYPCPSCETPVTISPQTEDGSIVKCPSCEGNIRVKRKPQKQEV